MVSEKVFQELKKRYGEKSSWAIWESPEKGKPKSNIGETGMFDDPNILSRLNTNYIFVGLNPAEHDNSIAGMWKSFHSGDNKRQNDFKLRHAFAGTIFEGSYITDLIKDYIKTDSKETIKLFKKDSFIREKACKELKEELDIIGGHPILIAFGSDVYNMLMTLKKDNPQVFSNVKKIEKLFHYSNRIRKDFTHSRYHRNNESIAHAEISHPLWHAGISPIIIESL